MSRRTFLAFLLSGALAAGLACPLGGVASGAALDPVTDCSSHGRLTQQYTVAELRHALATLPADTKEYTPCYDELNAALLSAIHGGKGGGSGGSGGGFLSTPIVVVVVVLLVAAATLGAIALRRRRDAPPTP